MKEIKMLKILETEILVLVQAIRTKCEDAAKRKISTLLNDLVETQMKIK